MAQKTFQEAERKQLFGDAQRAIALDAPYVSLWTKTNVAVYRAELHGVKLNPVAEFSFMKDVYR